MVGVLLVGVLAAGLSGAALSQPAPSSTARPHVDALPSSAPTPEIPDMKVAFLGDSYTNGTGADPVEKRWTSQVAAAFHWEELNYGQGGTGYASQGPTPPTTAAYVDRISDLIAKAPDVVIVAGGRNDLGVDTAQVSEHVTATFAAIRAGLPNAQVFAINPWFDARETPPRLDALAAEVKTAVESIGGVYLPTGQPLLGHPEFLIADEIHPNTAGHSAFADSVTAALRPTFG